MLLLGGTIFAVMYYGTQEQVNKLSTELVERTLLQTRTELDRFLRPVTRSLGVAYHWSQDDVFKLYDAAYMRHLLSPVLTEFPQMSSLLVANSRGEEYMLLRGRDFWQDRETRLADWGDKSRVNRWQAIDTVESQWQTLNYDPSKRPWFTGALQQLRQAAADPQAKLDLYSRVHWTEPYSFFTTKEPGVTASMAYFDKEGNAHVVAIDILLTDISRFTTKLKVSERGMVFVLTDDGLMLGLPNTSATRDSDHWQALLLKAPKQLGVPVINTGIASYRQQSDKSLPFSFESGNELWWGGAVDYKLAEHRKLLIGVVVPEQDVIGDIQYLRYGILLILVALVLLTLIRIIRMARRYSRPLEALVEDSYRISHGDLGEPNRIASRVTELQQLAKAHDVMREGLRNLLRMERDMQLAKQIQQKTLPQQLPAIPHFQTAVWNFPADETGGDSYDVFNVRRTAEGLYRLTDKESSFALCILADAAGHGIGPALSVTQVRSMLRMAARQGFMMPQTLQDVNRQILDDQSGGRFITLWLGILDAQHHCIHSYSAGQAPLLYYQATENTVKELEADSPPLGVIEQMPDMHPQIFSMSAGDFFVVLSDGIYEAKNDKGEEFGRDRVKRLIMLNASMSAEQVLEQLQHGLDVFTGHSKPRDDRTAIFIKYV